MTIALLADFAPGALVAAVVGWWVAAVVAVVGVVWLGLWAARRYANQHRGDAP